MKIELEINPAELVKEAAKKYAKLLYEKCNHYVFGMESDVGKVVKAKALKVLKQDAKFNKTIEDLLKDKEFVKNAVSKVIVEATEDVMRGDD